MKIHATLYVVARTQGEAADRLLDEEHHDLGGLTVWTLPAAELLKQELERCPENGEQHIFVADVTAEIVEFQVKERT